MRHIIFLLVLASGFDLIPVHGSPSAPTETSHTYVGRIWEWVRGAHARIVRTVRARYWQRVTLRDARFIADTLMKQHPASVLDVSGQKAIGDQLFVSRVHDGLTQLEKQRAQVKNQNDYERALTQYVNSFDDSHLKIQFLHHKMQPNSSMSVEAARDPAVVPDIDTMRQRAYTYDEFEPHQFWIRIPSFAPTAIEEIALNALIADVAYFTDATRIVFDLRGNTGGNSAWGSDILRALFGGATAKQSCTAAKLFVVIDSACAGAVFGFIDELKALSGRAVTIIGESASNDSASLEMREVKLPSGQGLLRFSIKAYQGCLRGNKVSYAPSVVPPVDLQDTAALKKWFAKTYT